MNKNKGFLISIVAVILLTAILFFFLTQNNESKTDTVNFKDEVAIKEIAEKFTKVMYTMKQNESYNSKKDRVDSLITKELSKKLFERKDIFNIYGDIKVTEIKVNIDGTKAYIDLKQELPKELVTDSNKSKSQKAELDFIKDSNDKWKIKSFKSIK